MKNTRWMKSVLKEAEKSKARMPWERGIRRQAMISRRTATKFEAAPHLRAAAQ